MLWARHCSWFEQFAETSKLKLRTRDWLVWLRKLDAERDNLRAALGWALDKDANPLAGAHLANHLTDYWSTRGHVDEGYRWLEKILEVINHQDPIPLTLPIQNAEFNGHPPGLVSKTSRSPATPGKGV